MEAMDSTQGWVPASTSEGISVSLRQDPNSLSKGAKGEGHCSANALLLFTLVGDPHRRHLWDRMVDNAKVLEHVDRLTRVALTTFRTMWPVSRREMLVVGRGQREDDGSFFSFATSIDYPALPVSSGSIRATLHFYGVRLWPEGKGRCRFCYVAMSDPLGWLPKSLVNQASVMQPMSIGRLNRLVREKKEVRTEMLEAVQAKMKKEGFDEEGTREKEEGKAEGKSAQAAGEKANGHKTEAAAAPAAEKEDEAKEEKDEDAAKTGKEEEEEGQKEEDDEAAA